MYGKIFDSMYDGTLAEDWRALITFQQMIVLCDADGIIDMTPSAISRRTGIPIEHIKAGIEILESEDPESRTSEENGRRICRLDDHKSWGWYLVNHKKYRDMRDADTVRAQNRERKIRQRAKGEETSNDVTLCHALSRDVTLCHASSRHTDTYTDTNKDKGKNQRAVALPNDFKLSDEMRENAKKKFGQRNIDIDQQFVKFTDHHQAKGSKFKSWPHAWGTWTTNARDFYDKDNPQQQPDPDQLTGRQMIEMEREIMANKKETFAEFRKRTGADDILKGIKK